MGFDDQPWRRRGARPRMRAGSRPAEARAALARRFPAGSAKTELEAAEANGERGAVERLAGEVVALAAERFEGRKAGAVG